MDPEGETLVTGPSLEVSFGSLRLRGVLASPPLFLLLLLMLPESLEVTNREEVDMMSEGTRLRDKEFAEDALELLSQERLPLMVSSREEDDKEEWLLLDEEIT